MPTGERYPPLDLTPQRQKQRTLEVLVDQLAGLAAAQPVLLAYEDVHWIDPTTLELLGLAIERIQRLPVLAADHLPAGVHAALVGPAARQRAGAHPARPARGRGDGRAGGRRQGRCRTRSRAQIVAKTDGVPLFVEELTKTVLESGLLDGRRRPLRAGRPAAAARDPGDAARLAARPPRPPRAGQGGGADRRRDRPRVLPRAARRGRRPARSRSCRPPSTSWSPPSWCSAAAAPPEATYSFKHALVQDAAYGTLLKSTPPAAPRPHRRRCWRSSSPRPPRPSPSCSPTTAPQAGLVEKAVDYWHKAGRQAIARSAMVEAAAQLTQALELLAGLPAGPERDRKELDLQIALGAALIATKGWAAPEVERAYARARELCTERGPDPAAPGRAVGAVPASPALVQQARRPPDRGGAAALGRTAAGRRGASRGPPLPGRQLAVQRAAARRPDAFRAGPRPLRSGRSHLTGVPVGSRHPAWRACFSWP